MRKSLALVVVAVIAVASALAWARPGRGVRDLVRPRTAPIARAAGKVIFRLTPTGRVVDFRLSGLGRRKRYAVRFNQDEHAILRAARTDSKGRARFSFGSVHLPYGVLEPIANRPIEIVTFQEGFAGDQVLVGRIPIAEGFPYWGQPGDTTGSSKTRLPGVDGNGPFAVESAAVVIPTSPSALAPGTSVVWYPGADGAIAAGGPYPPIVFVHATGFGANDYANWGRKIASWGFVVTVLDYADTAATTDGQEQVRATIAAIDWLAAQNADASSFLHGQLDVQKFGLVGHARGGAAAIIAAAHPSSLGRVKAAVGLAPQVLRLPSGSLGEFVTYAPNAATGFWPPTLVLTATQDGLVNPSDSRIVYFDHAPAPRGTVQVEGHCNMSYADSVPAALAATSDYDPSTCETPASQQQVARTYVIPWLVSRLRGDTRVQDYVDGTYAAEQINVVEETFE